MIAALAVTWSGCGSGAVSTARAPPPALADAERVRFVALGDAGKGDEAQRAVADAARAVCARKGCDFVLLLGDNVYPRGLETDDDPRAEERIVRPYAGIAPLYAVLGNHDWAGTDRATAEREVRWAAGRSDVSLPAQAWWFEAGPLLLVGGDTTAVFQEGDAFQAAWVADRLDGSAAPWKVFAGHHPFRSDGPHGNAGAYEGWRWVPWVSGRSVARFYEAAVCGRADLALAGHDHTRQLLSACGADLVVSGTGASGTRIVDRGNAPVFADAELGFAWLELRADGTGEVSFHGASGAEDARFDLPLARE